MKRKRRDDWNKNNQKCKGKHNRHQRNVEYHQGIPLKLEFYWTEKSKKKMDEFLDSLKSQKWNQEEIDNLNRPMGKWNIYENCANILKVWVRYIYMRILQDLQRSATNYS